MNFGWPGLGYWNLWLMGVAVVLPCLVIACSGNSSDVLVPMGTLSRSSTSISPTVSTPIPTSTPVPAATLVTQPNAITPIAATATPTNAPVATPKPEPPVLPKEVVVEVMPGSVARYRVREQFARKDFPNDAIGETEDVTGSIVFDSGGMV